MMPSHWELMIIMVVVLLLFGAKRLPGMAKGVGQGIREFRSAVKDVKKEVGGGDDELRDVDRELRAAVHDVKKEVVGGD